MLNKSFSCFLFCQVMFLQKQGALAPCFSNFPNKMLWPWRSKALFGALGDRLNSKTLELELWPRALKFWLLAFQCSAPNFEALKAFFLLVLQSSTLNIGAPRAFLLLALQSSTPNIESSRAFMLSTFYSSAPNFGASRTWMLSVLHSSIQVIWGQELSCYWP